MGCSKAAVFGLTFLALAITPGLIAAAEPDPSDTLDGSCVANSNALGVSRVIEIDTTEVSTVSLKGSRTQEHLREHEVVLTFDDGPSPAFTLMVLKALRLHCVKATFFPVGRMVAAYPEILRQVEADGHTIGSHTWSHADLGHIHMDSDAEATTENASARTTSNSSSDQRAMPPKKAIAEIERGVSMVAQALGKPGAPFFRFPYLSQTKRLQNYLASRSIASFSIDVDSLDYRRSNPDDMANHVLREIDRAGKGILLFHDIQSSTAHGLPRVLDALKSRGYRVVHVRAKSAVATLSQFDSAVVASSIGHNQAKEPQPKKKSTMAIAHLPHVEKPKSQPKPQVSSSSSFWNWTW